jgi:peptidoglycan/xylan/chitin deacetylase (PgdA/CDA1 family)
MIAIDQSVVPEPPIEMQMGEQQPVRKSSLKRFTRKCLLAACGITDRLPDEQGLLLTFDDGPDPRVTPAVLDLLAEYRARAVFFVVGNRIPKAPYLLRRILDEGHSIGNHTYFHPLNGIPRLREYYRDVRQCQTVLEAHTGVRPSLFRPPLGALTVASLIAPRMAGLRTMLWSVDVGDWGLRNHLDAPRAGERLAQAANPGDIVLLHDDNACVVTLLQVALPALRQRQLQLAGTPALR